MFVLVKSTLFCECLEPPSIWVRPPVLSSSRIAFFALWKPAVSVLWVIPLTLTASRVLVRVCSGRKVSTCFSSNTFTKCKIIPNLIELYFKTCFRMTFLCILHVTGVLRGFYSGFGPILFKQVPYTMAKCDKIHQNRPSKQLFRSNLVFFASKSNPFSR